ncbi:MAG: 3D domain-containing protein [Alphaproteobacteria bacterium]|uniref:3D domain-containing protein n=1 Tax=Candidatus Nitrobium versatile TaxID=2884831 RepID=A0A953JA96_9BACT|nr:3D domain-containing protein [Candidatus Nitrobium versatile]
MVTRNIMYLIRCGSLFLRGRHLRTAFPALRSLISRIGAVLVRGALTPLFDRLCLTLGTILFLVTLFVSTTDWRGKRILLPPDRGQKETAGAMGEAGEKTLGERIEEYMFDRIGEFTAYNPVPAQTGPLPFLMASGKYVYEKALACPERYTFGTKIHIDGLGIYTCEDRMARRFRRKENFDILMFSVEEAKNFGRRLLKFRIVPDPPAAR